MMRLNQGVLYRKELPRSQLSVRSSRHTNARKKRASVTEYVDVRLPNALMYWISRAASLLGLFVGDNPAF